jgi:GntR family transcriptional regulator
MKIRHESPVPLYVQLKEHLHAQIETGAIPPGSRLPSERELAREFDVSRMTARQALQALSREKAICFRVGKGTFAEPPKIELLRGGLTSFTEEMRKRNLTPSSRVLKAEIRPADVAVAQRLNIPFGSEIVYLSRLRFVEGVPLAIENSHLVHHVCPGILEKHDLSRESLYEVLRGDYQCALVWAEEFVGSRLAAARERRLLGIDSRVPLISIERVTYTHKDRRVEYVSAVLRGDRHQLHVVLR